MVRLPLLVVSSSRGRLCFFTVLRFYFIYVVSVDLLNICHVYVGFLGGQKEGNSFPELE